MSKTLGLDRLSDKIKSILSTPRGKLGFAVALILLLALGLTLLQIRYQQSTRSQATGNPATVVIKSAGNKTTLAPGEILPLRVIVNANDDSVVIADVTIELSDNLEFAEKNSARFVGNSTGWAQVHLIDELSPRQVRFLFATEQGKVKSGAYDFWLGEFYVKYKAGQRGDATVTVKSASVGLVSGWSHGQYTQASASTISNTQTFRIADAASTPTPTGAATATATPTFTPTPAPALDTEPNNLFEDAQGPLLPDELYHFSISSERDDWDVFFVDTTARGSIRVYLEGMGEGTGNNLYLYDNNKIRIGYSGNRQNRNEVIQTGDVNAGHYFVAVRREIGHGPYQLLVNYPNRPAATATPTPTPAGNPAATATPTVRVPSLIDASVSFSATNTINGDGVDYRLANMSPGWKASVSLAYSTDSTLGVEDYGNRHYGLCILEQNNQTCSFALPTNTASNTGWAIVFTNLYRNVVSGEEYRVGDLVLREGVLYCRGENHSWAIISGGRYYTLDKTQNPGLGICNNDIKVPLGIPPAP